MADNVCPVCDDGQGDAIRMVEPALVLMLRAAVVWLDEHAVHCTDESTHR